MVHISMNVNTTDFSYYPHTYTHYDSEILKTSTERLKCLATIEFLCYSFLLCYEK